MFSNKDDCTGCWACYSICPQNCISMVFDEEGFRYPQISHEKCTQCNKCISVCPINKDKLTTNYGKPIFYTAISKSKETLKESSSGGVFSILAEHIILQGGFVYGCIIDENMKVKHIGTNSIDEIKRMRGSKYVQSDINKCYFEIKKHLVSGKKVLFSGTPCQISGLKHYLSIDYSNLLLVEVVCHGVPSPVLFGKHICYLNKKHKGKVVHYEFRSKKKFGWGSENRTYYEVSKNGKIKGFHPVFAEYFSAFFYGLSLRPACYKCKYSTPKRAGDLTLGDFWGYWAKYKKYFPQGISVVGINNNKGKEIFDEVSSRMEIDEISYSEATKTNIHFFKPMDWMKEREDFYTNNNKYGYENIYKQIFVRYSKKINIIRTLYGRFIPAKARHTLQMLRSHLTKTFRTS